MKICFNLFISLVFVSISHAEIKQLDIGISNGYPPFYFFDESTRPTGICIDIINHIAKKMNIVVTYESYPWKRLLLYSKTGEVDAMMPLFQTEKRRQFLIFPETGLIAEKNQLFISSSKSITYSGNFSDIDKFSIGVIDKYSYGKEFDNTDFPHKTVFQSMEQLLKMVVFQRIELGIGSPKVIAYKAKKMDIGNKIHFLMPPVTTSPLYIGFSKKRINEDFVNRFNKYLQELKSKDVYKKIIHQYD